MNPLYLTFAFGLLNYSGVSASRVTLSLYALSLGAQPSEMGLLMATFFVFPLLLSWPIGMWADRIGSRGLLLFGLFSGTAGMVVPYFWPNLYALYIAGALSGLSFVFCSVLVQNLVGVLSEQRERARNFSNVSIVGSTANVIGPLVAGFTIDHAGHAVASLCSAGMFLAAFVMVAVWGAKLPSGEGKPRATVGGTLRERLSDKAVMRIIFTATVLNVGIDLYSFYLPIYGHRIGLSASAIGSILATYSVAVSAVRIWLPRFVAKAGEEILLAGSFFAAAAGFLLVPLFENAVTLAVISLVFGFGMGCGQPVATILLFSKAPERRSGETLGLRQAVTNVGRVISPPVFGFIASAMGLFSVFLISAFLMGVAGMAARPAAVRRQNDRSGKV